MTKLRCTLSYQFKSPMEPKDSTPLCRNKAMDSDLPIPRSDG